MKKGTGMETSGDRKLLTESQAKELLVEAGLSVPSFNAVSTPAEAKEAAESIGYPVAIKVSTPTIQHKSDWADGVGVQLDITDGNAVETAAEEIIHAANGQGLDVEILTEQQVSLEEGIETLVGGTRDPSFGPTLLFGLGGVYTELMDDVTQRLAPIGIDEAERMTEEIQGAELLDGFRDTLPVDRREIASVITTVGDLLIDRDDIVEIEINPLFATGSKTVALDALVVLAD
jgi:succinyl-CoA synthetase beta subunit